MAQVWVVDDEPLIRTAVLAVLAEMGHDARGFGNAEELYTALVEEGSIPDLLVLDQRLPDEFGSTIVHSLRERLQYRDIPVLFLTAHSSSEDLVAAFQAGADDFVSKPFRAPELKARVLGLLRRTQPLYLAVH